MFESRTLRFLYDPKAKHWRTPTPRRWQPPGHTRRGFICCEIWNCPIDRNRAEIALRLPPPPAEQFHLDYNLAYGGQWNTYNVRA